MSKKERMYCKIGQAVVEGIQVLGLATVFVATFIVGIIM